MREYFCGSHSPDLELRKKGSDNLSSQMLRAVPGDLILLLIDGQFYIDGFEFFDGTVRLSGIGESVDFKERGDQYLFRIRGREVFVQLADL